jgi:hypothetical protein
VFSIIDCAQVKQGFIEIRQAGQVIGTYVHVMKLEIHRALLGVDDDLNYSLVNLSNHQ